MKVAATGAARGPQRWLYREPPALRDSSCTCTASMQIEFSLNKKTVPVPGGRALLPAPWSVRPLHVLRLLLKTRNQIEGGPSFGRQAGNATWVTPPSFRGSQYWDDSGGQARSRGTWPSSSSPEKVRPPLPGQVRPPPTTPQGSAAESLRRAPLRPVSTLHSLVKRAPFRQAKKVRLGELNN